MSCLLMQFVAPMQSWGSRSRFQERDTEREPTKSGVLGLVCAAIGRDRKESIDDLVLLKMGVRVDMEGSVKADFHTAMNVIKADGSSPDTQISSRFYLEDAAFLVGLEGDVTLLRNIEKKLKNPVWPMFLGRKSFVLGEPVCLADGLLEKPLELALSSYPSIAPLTIHEFTEEKKLRFVLECGANEEGEIRQDVPVSFNHEHRKFMSRYVKTIWVQTSKQKDN